MRLHYALIFVLALFCKTSFATHAFPLVNYGFTAGPTGITVSGSSNGATCGGGPYWMQIEVSCSPTGFGGVQPTCLINALTNWTGPGVTYVSYPFFNSLLNIPGYNAASGWNDQCVQEPYNNILIPYSYFCPGTTMYFRAREAVYGTTSTGPWTAVNSFVVPGVPPVVCSASLTHSPFTTTLSPACPGAKTLTILNPNCPLPCASPALAPSCVTSTVYYKYYANPGGLQAITVNPTLALPSVTATTTYSVFRVDSCGGNGVCPPKSSCGFPGGGWPQMTTIFISAPNILVAATPATICPTTSSTLTATGGVTYTWMPGSLPGGAVVVSPVTTQIYTVTATNSISCVSSKTVQVTVTTAPVISVNTNTNVVCAGSPATLTANGATNYTWSTGANGSVTVVNPTITTTYTVVGGNGSCTGSNTINISVIGSPTVAAFSSTNTICAGSTVALLAGGALTFTWQPGNLTGSSVNVSPAATTIYTVTGTLLSCTDTETLLINVSNGPTMTVVGSPTTICSASGGSATLTATGAVSYTWNPGAVISSSLVITPTVTTNYFVTGANALGCLSTNTVSYSVTPTPTLNTSASSTAVCAGSSATLSATGATSYTWNPGALIGGTVAVTPATTTTYTIIGANGSCTSSKTIALVVNANPTLTANASPTLICSGNSSTLTSTGALSYTWNPGALPGGTVTVIPASTTVYTVTGTNAAGCKSSATRQVSVNITPTLNPISTPTSVCIGSSATLATSGASSYTWNPGALTGGTVIVTPAATTVYTVTGITANCSDTKTISLLVNPIPTVNATVSPTVICSGASATLMGSGALTYTWNPGNITGNPVTVTPTATTLYTVTGSNGSCTSTKTVSLIVNPNPTITAVASPTNICIGSSATLSSSGATSYTWNPGALPGGTVTVTPLATTLYTVTGANVFGCTVTKTVNLIVTPIPTINLVASPATICATNSSTLTATGATNYTWNPGALTGSNVVVTPGSNTTYTVTGSSGACSSTATIAITVNPNPTITAVVSPTTICAGSSATLSSSGATSYTWNPGALIGGTVTVTPATTILYTVTGTNGFGCTATKTVNLIVTPIPTVNATASPTAICIGASSTLTATGATTYSWMPGSLTGSNVSITPTITTTYTVTGSNGTCSNTKTVTVIVNPLPTLTVVALPTAICSGASATLTATGANAYNWLPGALSGSVVVVNPTLTTTYTVIGTSAAGCSNTKTITLIVNPIPSLTVVASPTTVCSGNSTTLAGTATNGGPFVSVWNPGTIAGNTAVVSPATNTTYTWSVTNSFGCSNTATISINVTITPTVIASASVLTICAGSTTSLLATGATSYTWNPGALSGGTVSVTPTITTTYTVIGSNGSCTNTKTVTITVNPNPTITAVVSPTNICAGGSATLSSSGATSYTWNPGALPGGTVTVNPAITTLYTVTASNGFGCTTTKTVNLIVTPNPTVNATASPTIVCAGSSVSLSATGAANYTWNPGAITSGTITVTPTITTTYTVTGANGNCSNTKTVTVIVNPLPTLTVVATPTAICSGASATLTATGANAYNWLPAALSGSAVVVNPTITTTYTVIGTSSAGCSNTKTITLIVNPIPSLTVVASPTAICSGNSTTLTGTAANGGPFVSVWNPGAIAGSTAVVSPSVNTIYTWSVVNSFLCSNSATININVTSTPTLNAIASSPTICAGATTSLVANGATSYTWNPLSLAGGTVAVTPTITTNYTVTGANGSCISTKTVIISVNPNPTITVTASPANICAGSSATLSSSGAISYTWFPGAITGGTIVVTPTVTTTYSVAATNAFGCGAANLVTLNVTPNPTLIIGVPLVPICTGNNATLVAMGATNYTWLPGGSTTTILITPLTATTIFTLIGSNGLCQSTQTVGLVPSPNPTIFATTSPTTICAGSNVTLTAAGATTYSWNPTALTGSNVVTTPTINTTYTVTGTDLNGCSGQSTVNVNVSPIPTLTATSSATSICVGTTVTLTANGSGTYTWNPTGLTSGTLTDTPTVTTTYTVSSSNAFGCIGTGSVTVVVNSVPSLTVSPLNTTVCSGYSTTLTAMGATNYTWLPSGNTTSTTVETPTINTTYTVMGANGVCSSSATVTIFVTPLPANLTATTSGSITCSAPTVTLTGSSTSTNVSYLWNGPFSYTSVAQNPTVSIQGTYTFNVIDNATGCIASITLSVPTDSTIPTVTTAVSGSITCATTSVTINAGATSTNVSYAWTGPNSFTSSVQTFTSSQSGAFTVTVTDLNSTCSTTAIVTVGIHTNVAVTASITPATCTGSVSNNDGTISVSNFTTTDKYDYVSGITYTGTATYLTATTIPTTGIITNTLANPTGTVAYTLRLFDAYGCFKDTMLILIPINCLSVNSLGIAKAVSAATLNLDGSYDITYKVVVKNYGLLPLTDVTLTENLNNTFPLPATFTVTIAPLITSTGSSLTIDPLFDGNLQTSLTTGLTSTLNIGQSDTIVFGVKVIPNGFFGPFNNYVIGLASPSPSVYVSDSSNVGLDPDPDIDLDPTNNNIPTPLNLTPNIFFGITKKGEVGIKQTDKTYDITYTITIHNLGNDTLKNVTAKDSLFNNTVKYPASYTMKSGPVTTGSLNANSLYNGNTDINLLAPGQNVMAPGSVNTIIFTINVNTDTVTVFKNSAFGNALSSTSITVSDTSNTGNNPDSNNNGVWNEPTDNVPTVLTIPNSDFFIPDGFTPNGDLKNDLFIIKGLPVGIDNVFTVYNRWGNKVYAKDNYDNTWNGTANVNGTLGTEKLPQGTYYYILEFKGGDIKTTNGFLIIQY
jgi:gliding motility-associated-like protein